MREIVSKDKYPIIFGFFGFSLGLLMLILGFIKTLILILITCSGIYLGIHLDSIEFFDSKKK